MSYSTIANDLIFKPCQQADWEIHPYKKEHYQGPGDEHYYKYPDHDFASSNEITKEYVKLNIRSKLHALYPGEFPNMTTVGYAVKNVLNEVKIVNYFSVEDRGWEASDYWACLEIIYISDTDYTTKILCRQISAPPSLSKTTTVANKAIQPNPNKKVLDNKPAPVTAKKQKTSDEEIEREFECPILKTRMINPVSGPDGYTYEKEAIEKWLKENPHSPMTNQPMTIEELSPNRTLKNLIELYTKN